MFIDGVEGRQGGTDGTGRRCTLPTLELWHLQPLASNKVMLALQNFNESLFCTCWTRGWWIFFLENSFIDFTNKYGFNATITMLSDRFLERKRHNWFFKLVWWIFFHLCCKLRNVNEGIKFTLSERCAAPISIWRNTLDLEECTTGI